MKKAILILVASLAIVSGLWIYLRLGIPKRFSVVFLNIGQGDAALIRLAGGQKILVDCGPNRKILSALGRNLPFFDRELDVLIVTHPDSDHYGGCADVLRRYRVKEIITNGVDKPSDPLWPAWQAAVQSEKALNTKIIQPITRDWGGLKWKFLSPDPSLSLAEKDQTDNNLSVVFRLSVGAHKFLFTGDMEVPLENALLDKYCNLTPANCPSLTSDYLKVGHHGSDSSSGERFLAAVHPQSAIISVGYNKFGHPSLRVQRHLQRVGAQIWRTDEKGDIIVAP